MADGWVKLWRKSIDSGLIKNHNVWIFWTYCLMKANHEKNYKQVVGFQEIILQPGQFIFGRKRASEETGLSEQQIRTCLTFLKKYKNLTIKTTNKFSIITIVNWVTYQSKESEINQQSNQRVTSSQPASNHKQEPKNQRTKEVKKKSKPKKDSLSEYLQDKIIENNFIETKDKVFEFFTWRMTEKIKGKKQPYESEKGIDLLFKHLNGCRTKGLFVSECIDEAMGRPWLTPNPDYFKNSNSTGSKNTQTCKEWANE